MVIYIIIMRKQAFNLIFYGILTVHFLWLLSYASTYFFLYDDYALLGEASFNNWNKILTSGIINFYRPLTFVLIKLEYLFFGFKHPFLLILTNLIVHLFSSFLLYKISLKIFNDKGFSKLSVLFFCIGIFTNEVFFWYSCIFDIVSVFLFLSSIYLLLKKQENTKYLFFSLLLLNFSLYAKESMIVAPFIYLFFLMNSFNSIKRKCIITAVTFIAVIVYFILRKNAIGFIDGGYGNFLSLWQQMKFNTTANNLFHFYFYTGNSSNLLQIFTVAAFSMILIAFLWNVSVRNKKHIYFLFFWIISLLPVIILIPSGRLHYFPSIFYSLILASGLSFIAKSNFNNIAKYFILISIVSTIFVSHSIQVYYKYQNWKLASLIAKNTIKQIENQAENHKKISIKNLPCILNNNFGIMKSYAYMYYKNDSTIKIFASKCDILTNKNTISLVNIAPDVFSTIQDNAALHNIYINYNFIKAKDIPQDKFIFK